MSCWPSNSRISCVVVLLVVASAGATPITVWVNDFSTLEGVSCGDPNCEPYLYDGGAWCDACSGGGSVTMEVEMCDLQAPEAYDITHGEITIVLQREGDAPEPGPVGGVWVRFYSRVWDDDSGLWVFSGSQNYFFEVEYTSELHGYGPGWQTFVCDVDDYDETGGWGPFYSDQVYKFRLDCVTWGPPERLGISHCEIVRRECPNDLDGDDDVDLADLAALLGEYGCTPTTTVLYDAGGFEGFAPGDLDGQDGWEVLCGDGLHEVVDDPTGSGVGQVVRLDALDGTEELVAIQRLVDTPVASGVVVYEWDQYREDLGDNVWICDDSWYDGWWAIQWDLSDPHTTSAAGWPGAGAEIRASVWEHVRYELDLDERCARVRVDDGEWSEYANFVTGDSKGLELEIQDTPVAGNGCVYLDNVSMSVVTACMIDYDGDGDTDLADLAELLSSYGCGAE